jgi:hypothetical protein
MQTIWSKRLNQKVNYSVPLNMWLGIELASPSVKSQAAQVATFFLDAIYSQPFLLLGIQFLMV